MNVLLFYVVEVVKNAIIPQSTGEKFDELSQQYGMQKRWKVNHVANSSPEGKNPQNI